ncbi:hypothetical protein BSL78_14130 [Apostichopus japonicus]|uniref:Uncharacterized protein n=1 Tax=Stichopus japonicus TaxID=307972 RepID=A0A2G8KLX5_STIJA|nr:hypothetical protein BSL78_14130 [Apostichopus japonicus]
MWNVESGSRRWHRRNAGQPSSDQPIALSTWATKTGKVFSPPQIPPQVKERLRSAGALDGKDKFREKGAQTLESSLFDVDRASRAGMKYSSALLLFAELLNRSFQQAQASGISRKDTAAIIALLGPVSRMVLDQFARVSVKATLTRRDLVLNSLNWSSRSTADAFRNLPILGRPLRRQVR